MLLSPCLSNRIYSLSLRITNTPMLTSPSPSRSTPLRVQGERTYVMICSGLSTMVVMLLAFGVTRVKVIRGRTINSLCGFNTSVLLFIVLRRLTKVDPSFPVRIIGIPPFAMIKRIGARDRKVETTPLTGLYH
jgi:hypothetical protein